MRIRVCRWGNSLAIRIPRNLAARAGLVEGSALDLVEKRGALVLKKPCYLLDELLAGMTDGNRHDEADWGSPVGREA
jgi:antitoxin MazE